jgi:ElaB/YqjD/DUF883 family membrane-anchored ribosome-binding protein
VAEKAENKDVRDEAADTAEQISRLREKVEMLMSKRITPALADAGEQAEAALHSASDEARRRAAMVSGRVREQPLMALLIAAGVGVLIGRVMR